MADAITTHQGLTNAYQCFSETRWLLNPIHGVRQVNDKQFDVFADWLNHYYEQHGIKAIETLHGADQRTLEALYTNYRSLVPGEAYSREEFREKMQQYRQMIDALRADLLSGFDDTGDS